MTQQTIGQACALLTALAWAFAMVLFKLSGERVPPLALNLFKNVVGLVLLAATIPLLGDGLTTLRGYAWRDIGILLISGVIGIAVADTVFFYSLNLIGVGIAGIVDCLYSPCIIFFSFLMLSERLGPLQFVGAALVLAGVLFTSRLKPPNNRTHRQLVTGILLGAVAMGMMGFGIVLAKPVLERWSLIWGATMRMLGGTVSLALLLLLVPKLRPLWGVFRPSSVWKWCLPGSVLGAYVAMVLWVAGFKYIDASIAAILNQTSSVFAIVLATLILKERFSGRKLLAVTMAITGVVLVWYDGTRGP